jgi:hypothetical protein
LVQESRNGTIEVLNDKDLASSKILGRAIRNDLVNDIVELDLEIF